MQIIWHLLGNMSKIVEIRNASALNDLWTMKGGGVLIIMHGRT